MLEQFLKLRHLFLAWSIITSVFMTLNVYTALTICHTLNIQNTLYILIHLILSLTL